MRAGNEILDSYPTDIFSVTFGLICVANLSSGSDRRHLFLLKYSACRQIQKQSLGGHMNISFTFKNFEASEHLKKYARRRMEKLGRFFGKAAGLEVGVVLTVDKIRNRCEVTVVGEGLHLAASEQTNDMYAAIDLVYDKLESQIKKHVSRVKEQRRQARNATIDVFTYNLEAEAPADSETIGTDRFSPKPMPVEEAMMQLDNIGSDFFVFLNADSGRVNVIYRRRTGDYGLIDPIV